MPFQIQKLSKQAMIVTINGILAGPELDRYCSEYVAMYDAMDRFVLILDIRGMDFPSVEMFTRKKTLSSNLKHRTISQVMGIVVFVEYEILKELAIALVKAGGQAAPLSIVSRLSDCVQTVADWIQIMHRQTPASIRSCKLLYKHTPPAAIVSILVMRFIMFMRHFIRYEFTMPTL